jgi:hypothetical protein
VKLFCELSLVDEQRPLEENQRGFLKQHSGQSSVGEIPGALTGPEVTIGLLKQSAEAERQAKEVLHSIQKFYTGIRAGAR